MKNFEVVEMKKKDQIHVEIRDYVEALMGRGLTIEEVADILGMELGSRFVKYTAKWYKYCFIAKKNQKKAIEKHPNIYSKAGKIAQQKHPWIGHKLGKKYGSIAGKKRAHQLRKEGRLNEYMSSMAKRLQEIDPDHSRLNMRKAHETMKNAGTFHKHQREAALKCRKKNPHQLNEMSKIAHERYPLALLALESRRKNYPYKFMNCLFDSNQERKLCKTFVEEELMEKPVEKVNVHFRIKRFHIDFFLGNKVFVEYHPPIKYGEKNETYEGYFKERRNLLDENGYKDYPLVVITRLKNVKRKLKKIRSYFHSPSKLTSEKTL